MGQIESLLAANALPKIALPLLEAANLQQTQPAQTPPQSPSVSNTQDTVTISPEAAALQDKGK